MWQEEIGGCYRADGAIGVSRPPRSAPGGARLRRDLPQVRPNVNKRAQQIIAAHMCSHSSTASGFSSTMPVLTQIASTAPRTARTHDISHLCDQSTPLPPTIPQTLIAEVDHIYTNTFLPQDADSVYSEQDGLWRTKVFPSNKPSSRADAIMLDSWISRSLEAYQESGSCAVKEDLARAVEDLVPILSVALHEIVRQVTHHCAERGVVLEKIWRTYVELFDRVLRNMQESLRAQKRKTTEVQRVLKTVRDDLARHRKKHPENMHRVISDLEQQFNKRQAQFEDELKHNEEENARLKTELRTNVRELEDWYPCFLGYQDSHIKAHIPQYSRMMKRVANGRRPSVAVSTSDMPPVFQSESLEVGGGRRPGSRDQTVDELDEEMPAEVAIAEDFKRLLAALSQEKRKDLGSEFAFVFEAPENSKQPARKAGQRKQGLSDEAQEKYLKEKEEIDRLRAEVDKQEAHIQELRQEISELEKAADVKREAADAAALEAEVGRAESPDEEAPPDSGRMLGFGSFLKGKMLPAGAEEDDDDDDEGVFKFLRKQRTEEALAEGSSDEEGSDRRPGLDREDAGPLEYNAGDADADPGETDASPREADDPRDADAAPPAVDPG